MRIAIMQPYFLPYLGYFSLIKNTDKFILLDTVQFIRHGWIERNRILKPDVGWQYIQVPLMKFPRNTLIKDVLINNSNNWKQKLFSQLIHYKKKAPYYKHTMEFLKQTIENNYLDIVTLNYTFLNNICNYLDIGTPIEVFSKMDVNIEIPRAPDEWALNICKSLENIDEYWNPPGGIIFFDRSKFEKENINLRYHLIKLTPYNQKINKFESGLSIIDLMMFNSPKEINEMADNYIVIDSRVNSALSNDIESHLNRCNDFFYPSLDTYVNIREYSEKLKEKSYTFEAWIGNEMIGLVACYLNDKYLKEAYITNVSVLDAYQRFGIANTLIELAINKAKIFGFEILKLEVEVQNYKAIDLYKRKGLSISAQNGSKYLMTREIKNIKTSSAD